MKPLDRLEKLITQLIEGPFNRAFNPHFHPAKLARQLAMALEQNSLSDADGNCVAPNQYRVYINEADYQDLHPPASLNNEIAAIKRYLTGFMQETNCRIQGNLQVQILPHSHLPSGKVEVLAEHVSEASPPPPDTKQMTPVMQLPAQNWHLQNHEYHIPLGQPVHAMGRASDNDIILTNPAVSRHHAQLRWRDGCYHIKNLSRSQSLLVNQRVAQGYVALQAGDVLQLGPIQLTVQCQYD